MVASASSASEADGGVCEHLSHAPLRLQIAAVAFVTVEAVLRECV